MSPRLISHGSNRKAFITRARDVSVVVSIDTEEDNWGSFEAYGATSKNILQLEDLQERFDRWGAKPTYLVNRAPLQDAASVKVLGALADRSDVEIGLHCHPWNTPPLASEGVHRSMMCNLTFDENVAKLREVRQRMQEELGVTPRSFRAGRWALGATVARALVELGIEVDTSVSPFIDWSSVSGADYSEAPHTPYRFHPDRPLEPVADGPLLELPTTIGFLRGEQRSRARARSWLEASPLSRFGAVGLMDRAGLLTKRWLSPEGASGEEMVRLSDALVASGASYLQMTFHSPDLLPGATPFVRTDDDRSRFLRSVEEVLAHWKSSGFTFETLSGAAVAWEGASATP